MTQYRTTRDIVIPAGTVLSRAADQRGGARYTECFVAHGKHFASSLVVQVHSDALASGDFEELLCDEHED